MDRRISVAIQIVQLEHNRNVSIRELARRVNLSPWHFTHLFRAETSISPKQFIRDYKLELAAQLLRESFLSVKEVAATVGIGDRSHFSRDFKRVHGCAPSTARHQHDGRSSGGKQGRLRNSK
jgi:AraC family transcriptional regulator